MVRNLTLITSCVGVDCRLEAWLWRLWVFIVCNFGSFISGWPSPREGPHILPEGGNCLINFWVLTRKGTRSWQWIVYTFTEAPISQLWLLPFVCGTSACLVFLEVRQLPGWVEMRKSCGILASSQSHFRPGLTDLHFTSSLQHRQMIPASEDLKFRGACLLASRVSSLSA